MSIKEALIDMGFDTGKIEKAVSACGDNLEQAMEWLLAHADDQSSNTNPSSESNNASKTEEDSTGSKAEGSEDTMETDDKTKPEEAEEDVAKSLKCDECGKLFKTSEEVEFHAVKSGHSSFSESTEEKHPLTEEEKRLKLKDLEEKLRQRRRQKEDEDRKEAIEREKKRIQTSRDMAESKRKMEEQEMKKLTEERRREKLEDKMARQRVKEQIERDKIARKEMFGGGAKSSPAVNQSPAPVTSPTSNTAQPKKDYSSTRLQIRLPSGPPLVQEFKSKESLSAVRLWVGLNRKDRDPPSHSFNLSTTFPRKVFDEEDMDKPLSVLGLVPSAVLVVLDT